MERLEDFFGASYDEASKTSKANAMKTILTGDFSGKKCPNGITAMEAISAVTFLFGLDHDAR
jgi:hypothetical protein